MQASTDGRRHLIIQNSEFDHNQSGFVTNSQNNDDAPSPQDGACPGGGTGPTGSHSCWVFRDNSVHDNNNPNVPSTGTAAAPVGTGVVIAGGRHNTVVRDRVFSNNAWGILLVPFPEVGSPPPVANRNGGQGQSFNGQAACSFEAFGNEIANNTLANNGSYGNPTNGDLGEISNPNPEGNCWHGNARPDGSAPSAEPPGLQETHANCGQPNSGEPLAGPLGAQVACDSQLLGPCPVPAPLPAQYPRADPEQIRLALAAPQPTMPDPCLAVPRNAWCPNNPVNPDRYPVPGPPYDNGSLGRGGSRAGGACGGRRQLVLHLRRSISRRLRSATVTVNGRRLRVSGRRLTVRIDLRHLKRSTLDARRPRPRPPAQRTADPPDPSVPPLRPPAIAPLPPAAPARALTSA